MNSHSAGQNYAAEPPAQQAEFLVPADMKEGDLVRVVERSTGRRFIARVLPKQTERPRGMLAGLWYDFCNSSIVRAAGTFTLFPQLPEVDSSMYAQREALARVWRDVGGFMWTAFDAETARIREHQKHSPK